MILAVYFIWCLLFSYLLANLEISITVAVPMVVINAIITNPYLLKLI